MSVQLMYLQGSESCDSSMRGMLAVVAIEPPKSNQSDGIDARAAGGESGDPHESATLKQVDLVDL